MFSYSSANKACTQCDIVPEIYPIIDGLCRTCNKLTSIGNMVLSIIYPTVSKTTLNTGILSSKKKNRSLNDLHNLQSAAGRINRILFNRAKNFK